MFDLNNPIFQDADKAREHLESIRWPDGPVCPHCGGSEKIYTVKSKAARPGLYKCGDCRKQFTVTVGTVFERSHIALNKWVLATHLMCASKKGMSALQIQRMLGVTYKTAWFMCHRIREAMRPDGPGILGGNGKTVEADETYWGNTRSKARRKRKGARGYDHKEKILSLVERGGHVRSFHMPKVNAKTLSPVLAHEIAQDSKLMTDDAAYYTVIGRYFDQHGVVNHSSGEYAKGDDNTDTIEGFFSLLKRGLNGSFHHVSPAHLGRYVYEFDFRYNYRQKLGYDDTQRTIEALKGISGKRLTYQRTDAQA